MEHILVIPAAVIGVAVIVLGAALGVLYLSGSPLLSLHPPSNLAPLEAPVLYAVGDFLQSDDGTQVVIVTGYNADRDSCSFQPVVVNPATGTLRILEMTSTMPCQEFRVRYPERYL